MTLTDDKNKFKQLYSFPIKSKKKNVSLFFSFNFSNEHVIFVKARSVTTSTRFKIQDPVCVASTLVWVEDLERPKF